MFANGQRGQRGSEEVAQTIYHYAHIFIIITRALSIIERNMNLLACLLADDRKLNGGDNENRNLQHDSFHQHTHTHIQSYFAHSIEHSFRKTS